MPNLGVLEATTSVSEAEYGSLLSVPSSEPLPLRDEVCRSSYTFLGASTTSVLFLQSEFRLAPEWRFFVLIAPRVRPLNGFCEIEETLGDSAFLLVSLFDLSMRRCYSR